MEGSIPQDYTEFPKQDEGSDPDQMDIGNGLLAVAVAQ